MSAADLPVLEDVGCPGLLPRPPLGPVPPNGIDPSPHYDKVLPWTPPTDRDFLRANAWSVTIPDLPFVYGGSSEHPERCIQWFLPRWSYDWQVKILNAVCGRGYTHFITLLPDVVNDRPNLSLAQFVDLLRFIKGSMQYVQVGLGAKPPKQPRDMSIDQWKAYVDPILDAVLPICDEVVPGWEWDLWNVPGGTDSPSVVIPKYIGQRAHAAGVSCWMHFSPHVTYWGAAGTDCPDRFAYWSALGSDVDGIQYQQIPDNGSGGVLPIADAQARLVDTLSQFGRQGNQHKLRHFEDTASLGFTHDRPNEDDSDQRGYLACCTVDNVSGTDAKVWGYGNGGRRPDGSVL